MAQSVHFVFIRVFNLALSQLKIELDFSYLAATAQAPPQHPKLLPRSNHQVFLMLRPKLGKNSQRALRTPQYIFRYRPAIRRPKVLCRNVMKTFDTFIRHLSLQAPPQKAVPPDSSADVALDSEAVLQSCFRSQQEDTGQTKLKTLKEDSASRCGVAVIRAAPLLETGAISRSAQYIC
jgi:hypothetical protein